MIDRTIRFLRGLAAIVSVLAIIVGVVAVSLLLLQLGFDIMGDVPPALIALHLQHNFAGLLISGAVALPAIAMFAALIE